MDGLFRKDLLRLQEEQALRSFIDDKNERVYGTLLNVLVVFYFIAMADELFIRGIQPGRLIPAYSLMVNWMFVLGLWAYRRHGDRPRRFYPFLIGVLWIQVGLVLVQNSLDDYDVISLDFILVAIFLTSFWLKPQDLIKLFAALLVLPWLVYSLRLGMLMPVTQWLALKALVCVCLCGFGLWRIRNRTGIFHQLWQYEMTRNQERMRMKGELEQAKEIQLSMLPKHALDLPTADLSFRSLPATEVGGDYFDVFPSDDASRLELVIGDVSGHGVAAGLVLSGLKSSLHVLQADHVNGAETLIRLDQMLKQTTEKRIFVTMLYTRFDFENRTLALANAGHVPFFHFSRSADQAVIVEQRSIALGCPSLPTRSSEMACAYRESFREFEPGDVFVFLTDGIMEMMNAENIAFGLDRTKSILEQHARQNKSAFQIEQALISGVQEFMGKTEQFDDITLAVVKIKNQGKEDGSESKS